jgi:hypothetical protein
VWTTGCIVVDGQDGLLVIRLGRNKGDLDRAPLTWRDVRFGTAVLYDIEFMALVRNRDADDM